MKVCTGKFDSHVTDRIPSCKETRWMGEGHTAEAKAAQSSHMKRGWCLDGIPRLRDQKRRQIAATIITVIKTRNALSGGPRSGSGSAEVADLSTEDIFCVDLRVSLVVTAEMTYVVELGIRNPRTD